MSSQAQRPANGFAALTHAQQKRAAELLKMLTHPQRQAIVELLGRERALTVTQIYTALGLNPGITSQHLIHLKKRGVLTSEKSATFIRYSLGSPAFTEALACVVDVAGCKVL